MLESRACSRSDSLKLHVHLGVTPTELALSRGDGAAAAQGSYCLLPDHLQCDYLKLTSLDMSAGYIHSCCL